MMLHLVIDREDKGNGRDLVMGELEGYFGERLNSH